MGDVLVCSHRCVQTREQMIYSIEGLRSELYVFVEFDLKR